MELIFNSNSLGYCNLNKLRIHANPGIYTIKLFAYNYENPLIYKTNQTEIVVKDCMKDQVVLFDKRGIQYCENPICRSECPVYIRASCKSNNKYVNDPHKNQCACFSGWTGLNCDEKIPADFSKLRKTLNIIAYNSIFIVSLYIIFITFNKKKRIIYDIGYFKLLFFSLGIIFYFISNLFKTYDKYTGCAINFFFKHISSSLILVVYYVVITLGDELGIVNEEDEKYKFFSLDELDEELKSGENSDMEDNGKCKANELKLPENLHEMVNKRGNDPMDSNDRMGIIRSNSNSNYNYSSDCKECHNKKNGFYQKQGSKSFSDSLNIILKTGTIRNTTNTSVDKVINNMESMGNKNMIKCIKHAHSLFIEVVIVYIIYFFITVSMVLLYKVRENPNEINEVKDNNGYWSYKCELESHDIINYLGDIFILIVILLKGRRIYKYECIFRCTRYVTYSSLIIFALGPLINVISIAVLQDQRYSKIIFECTLNTIGYIIAFISFSWDKVYYILKKNGDDCNIYFIFKKHEMCVIHNSYSCWCKLERTKKDLRPTIDRYIDFYKFCSKLFAVIDGKIKYIKMKTKTDLLCNSFEKF